MTSFGEYAFFTFLLVAVRVGFYRDRASAKSLELTFDDAVPSVRIMSNRTNIEEVVINLITNAIRYTPEGIRAGVSTDKNHACIRVSDTGFGISEEDQEKIFDRFYRVKNEKTIYQPNGVGIGHYKKYC